MRLLLDTHTLIWAIADPSRLSTRAREAILEDSNELVVSAGSAWEIATKHRIGGDDAKRRVQFGGAAAQECDLARTGSTGEHHRATGPHRGAQEPGSGPVDHVALDELIEPVEGQTPGLVAGLGHS